MQKFLFVVSLIIVGCSAGDKPSDLPPLYPYTVTIMQDGLPLAEAMVELIPVLPTETEISGCVDYRYGR